MSRFSTRDWVFIVGGIGCAIIAITNVVMIRDGEREPAVAEAASEDCDARFLALADDMWSERLANLDLEDPAELRATISWFEEQQAPDCDFFDESIREFRELADELERESG